MTQEQAKRFMLYWLAVIALSLIMLLTLSNYEAKAQVKRKPAKSLIYHRKLQKKLMYNDSKCFYS